MIKTQIVYIINILTKSYLLSSYILYLNKDNRRG